MQSDNVISTLNKSLTSEQDDHIFNDLISRIQTFIDGQKWIKKPLALSPSVCSQYGWKCIKPDLLECVTCGAKLSVCEPRIGNFESYKACVEKTLCDLKDSHGKHCPWPLTPSPENFVRMIIMPKEEALSQFLKRVNSSLCFKSFPQIKESVISDLGFNEEHIMSLCKLAKVTTEDSARFGKSIIPLSATGWIITQDESEKPFLKCNNCLRSVWCGSFSLLLSKDYQTEKNEYHNENSEGSSHIPENGVESEEKDKKSDEPPAKKKRMSFVIKKGEPFDPLHEHRPWCLWIHDGVEKYTSPPNENESNQTVETASSVPGWKIFVKSLSKNISESKTLTLNNSPSKEQIRNVRNLLEMWTEGV